MNNFTQRIIRHAISLPIWDFIFSGTLGSSFLTLLQMVTLQSRWPKLILVLLNDGVSLWECEKSWASLHFCYFFTFWSANKEQAGSHPMRSWGWADTNLELITTKDLASLNHSPLQYIWIANHHQSIPAVLCSCTSIQLIGEWCVCGIDWWPSLRLKDLKLFVHRSFKNGKTRY